MQKLLEVLSLRDNDTLLTVLPENESNFLRGKISGFVEAYELVDTLVHTVEESHARRTKHDADQSDVDSINAGTLAATRWGSANWGS